MIRRFGSSPTDRLATPSSSLSTSWMTLRSDDVIGSSERATPDDADLLGDVTGELDERLLATAAIAGDVDAQAGLVVAEATLGSDTSEVLDRVQRPSARTDEQSEFRRRRRSVRARCRRRSDSEVPVHTERRGQAVHERNGGGTDLVRGHRRIALSSLVAQPVPALVACWIVGGSGRADGGARRSDVGRRRSRVVRCWLMRPASTASVSPRCRVVPWPSSALSALSLRLLRRLRSCFGRACVGRIRARMPGLAPNPAEQSGLRALRGCRTRRRRRRRRVGRGRPHGPRRGSLRWSLPTPWRALS